MNKLPETAWRRLRHLLTALSLVLLVACGPGTGGTGTGPSGSYASAAVGGSGAAPPPASLCTGECVSVLLQLEPERVELRTACLRFLHTGAWSVDAGGVATVDGEIESGGTRSAGTLRLAFEGEPEQSALVRVTLVDAGGRVLVGPLALQRRDAGGSPAVTACP